MSYLQDKKEKEDKLKKIAIAVIFLLFILYFRNGIYKGLSSSVQFISHPFITFGKNIGNGFRNTGAFFASKKNLALENDLLKMKISESDARMSNLASVMDENTKMKEILGRKKDTQNFIFSAILAKPNRSIYDTLLIDAGTKDGVSLRQKVFAYGSVPIGYIGEVYPNSAKVILYSNPGEKTDVVIPISGGTATEPIKNIHIEVTGRGGGNFEMSLPKDVVVANGTEAVLPGLTPYTLAKVDTIISDPRDSYQKALLASPVNIYELGFVEIEK